MYGNFRNQVRITLRRVQICPISCPTLSSLDIPLSVSPVVEPVDGKLMYEKKKLHRTGVNGVQDRLSLFYLANAQFVKPEVMMFISRAHSSSVLSESSIAVNTCSCKYHRILGH